MPDRWSDAWLLRFALPVPGMLHIVSNLLADVHEGMLYWGTFHGQLKTLEKLLAHRPRRERFVQSCVRGTVFAPQEFRYSGRARTFSVVSDHLSVVMLPTVGPGNPPDTFRDAS